MLALLLSGGLFLKSGLTIYSLYFLPNSTHIPIPTTITVGTLLGGALLAFLEIFQSLSSGKEHTPDPANAVLLSHWRLLSVLHITAAITLFLELYLQQRWHPWLLLALGVITVISMAETLLRFLIRFYKFDQFGSAFAIQGHLAAVGAPQATGSDDSSGSAYLFRLDTGEQLAELFPENIDLGDCFGSALAMNSTQVLIGAAEYENEAGELGGAAFLFSTLNFEELSQFEADDAESGDEFGAAVAISDEFLAIGAPCDDDAGTNSGSAYFYHATTHELLFKVIASDAAAGDLFGSAIAVSGNYAIVGAPFDDDNGTTIKNFDRLLSMSFFTSESPL